LITALLTVNLAAQAKGSDQAVPDQGVQDEATYDRARSEAFIESVRAKCGYADDETDMRRLKKANECVTAMIRINQQRSRLDEALRESLAKPEGGSPRPLNGGSASGTPTTCGNGAGFESPLIRVHRTVLTPQVAADDYGHRLAENFAIYQVTVENGSRDMDFMLNDVSMDFSSHFGAPAGSFAYSASGQDLAMLRGVPENEGNRSSRALNARLNRLSDSAFMPNTLIDKRAAKTMAIFVPIDQLLSKSEQREFRKDPNAFLGLNDPTASLNRGDVCVDGFFVQQVTLGNPMLNAAVIASDAAAGAATTVHITGANLVGGDTELVLTVSGPGISEVTQATPALVLTTDGSNGIAQVTLPAGFRAGNATAYLRSHTAPTLTSGRGIPVTTPVPWLR
jgi:hypothetical protein